MFIRAYALAIALLPKPADSRVRASSYSERNLVETDTDYDVIVGGAGYAGISAAHVLSDNNVTSFAILEATERLGGRMWEMEFGDGDKKYTVENGAQWIDGLTGNPAYIQAQAVGLYGVLQDFAVNVHDENGTLRRPEGQFAANTNSRRKLEAFDGAEVLVTQCLQDIEFPITDPDLQELCDALEEDFGEEDFVDRSKADVYKAFNGWDAPYEEDPAIARVIRLFR